MNVRVDIFTNTLKTWYDKPKNLGNYFTIPKEEFTEKKLARVYIFSFVYK